MKHRHDHRDPQPGDANRPASHQQQVPHYAARQEPPVSPVHDRDRRTGDADRRAGNSLYDGMPSVANRGDAPGGRSAVGRSAARHGSPQHGRGDGGQSYADNRITDAIIRRLREDPQIDASQILVMVDGGVVTLSGDVPDAPTRQRAESLVTAIRETRKVHNRLHVDDGSAAAGPPGRAIRSGRDQYGSGFSSSERDDPVYDDTTSNGWPSRR